MSPPVLDPVAIRFLLLMGPGLLVVALVHRHPPDQPTAAGAVQAFLWVLVGLVPLHLVAAQAGWWQYTTAGGALVGLPIDIWVGWALAWGAVPALAWPGGSLARIGAAAFGLDLAVMPLLGTAISLGPNWLIGEAVSVLGLLVVGQSIANWTRTGTHLSRRAALQIVAFGGLVLVVVPTVVTDFFGTNWLGMPSAAPTQLLGLAAPALILALSAFLEFVDRGGGTPIPWDPPKRLVTTGAYAYVANPMQLAMLVFFAIVAAASQSYGLTFVVLWLVLTLVGVITWQEHGSLEQRFGSDWLQYRRAVRNWIPRLRPYVGRPGGQPSRLYVAAGCSHCRRLGELILALEPIGLDVVPAECHPCRVLSRITYSPADADGPRGEMGLDCAGEEEGVAAVGRALEHVNFGLALFGMFIRLPGVSHAIQAGVDAAGFGPRPICQLDESTG